MTHKSLDEVYYKFVSGIKLYVIWKRECMFICIFWTQVVRSNVSARNTIKLSSFHHDPLVNPFFKVISIKTKNAHSRKELGRFINLTYLYFIKVIQSKERVSARCMMNSHYTFNLSTCVLSIRIKIAHSRTKLAYFIYSTFVNI